MAEIEQSEPSPAEPWEEEIDLRELILGIAKKWYIWLGLPLLVVLGTGIYYWTTPDRYQVREGAVLTLPAQQVESMEFSLPEAQTLGELLGEENLSGTVRVNRSIKPGTLEYTVNVSTTEPAQTAEQLREVLPEKFSQFLESYEDQLAEQRGALNRSLRWLQEDLAAWRRAVESAGFSPAEAGLAEFATDFRRKQAALRVLDQLDSAEEKLTVAPEALSEQELVGPNRPRNTLLAGAVTFLLTLFGTAFWEIL